MSTSKSPVSLLWPWRCPCNHAAALVSPSCTCSSNSLIGVSCVIPLFTQLFKHSSFSMTSKLTSVSQYCAACAWSQNSSLKRHARVWQKWQVWIEGQAQISLPCKLEVLLDTYSSRPLIAGPKTSSSWIKWGWFERSVVTRNMICHNVEEVWTTSQTELILYASLTELTGPERAFSCYGIHPFYMDMEYLIP